MSKRAIIPPAFKDAAESLNMSPGILAGDFLFLNGVTGGTGDIMPDDPELQFQACFDKIRAVLAEAGLGFNAIVEMTTYHVGLQDHFEQFDAVRLKHLSAPYPAWTAVEVAGLRRQGAIVELRVIAKMTD
ncbi:MAG: RidA family protein [Sneathiellales bacterium]|nr:RidA family protein [Sneathiellales bacterium]